MHGIFFSILLVLSLEKASCEDKAPMQSTLREPTTQSLSETRGSNDCREKVKEMVESHLRQTTKHPRPVQTYAFQLNNQASKLILRSFESQENKKIRPPEKQD